MLTYTNTYTWLINRNICQEYGFVNNARVIIESFGKNSINVRTLDKKQRNLSLPRIKFRFRVAYGQSYTILRVQYPLKLGINCIITIKLFFLIIYYSYSICIYCSQSSR